MNHFRSFLSVVLASLSLLILVLSLVLTAPGSPSSARAVSVAEHSITRQSHPHILKTHQAALLSGSSTTLPLVYHNGQVMQHSSTIYTIFWAPPKLPDGTPTHESTNYEFLLKQYFGDIGGSAMYNNNTQYYDNFHGHINKISTLGGAWIDNLTPYPTPSDCTDTATPHGCLTDQDIQAEVTHVMSVKGWGGGLNNIFFVFTDWGEGSCTDGSSTECAFTAYCAYHSDFVPSGKTQPILYTNMPYPGTDLSACGVKTSPNNDFDADSAINFASHEQMETITDPLTPNAPQSGWWDLNPNPPPNQDPHEEIGDKCAWQFGSVTLDGGKANVQWNGHYYIVQEEWSNFHYTVISHNGCTLGETSALLKGTAYISPAVGNNVSVIAFNTSDGSLRWSFQIPNTGYIEGGPILAQGLLYVSAGNNVYAINPTRGSQSRKFSTGGQINGSPAVVNGVVYICSDDQIVYAYNATNGALLWKYQTSAFNDLSPTVINNVVYFATSDGYLYALNATNGTLLWRVAGPSGFYSQPTVVNGVIYIGTLYGVDAFNATNGTLLWDYQVAGTGTARESVSFSPTIVNGVVYAGSTGLNGSGGHIIALNASNGTVLWPPYPTGTNPGIVSQPIFWGGTIYTGADGVYALYANTGILRWHQQASYDFSTPLYVSGVIMSNSNGGMFTLRTADGSVYWSNVFCCNDSSVSSPTVTLAGY